MVIKASALIAAFRRMIGWKYIWGAARTGVVDCSGAFTYAFRQLGSWMYHGSNTMYYTYSYDKGKVGEIPVLPGMAVYKCSAGSTNMHHVGLYVGAGITVEAKGTLYGCIVSRLQDWQYASKLRSKDGTTVDYDVQEVEPVTWEGTVNKTSSGTVNLRTGCSRLNSKAATVPAGATVTILDVPCNPGWYAIRWENKIGFMMSEFITPTKPIPTLEDRLAAIELRLGALEAK